MLHFPSPDVEDVDQLLLNARLRDELEPFLDESIELLRARRVSTAEENRILATLLAWERAPILPISQWFEPALVLPHPSQLSESELHQLLRTTISRLAERRIVLEMTDHLSDRQLYCLLLRDILPSPEKKIDPPANCLHFHCLDMDTDEQTWLRYYASPAERAAWLLEAGEAPPPREPLPYPRDLPRCAHG